MSSRRENKQQNIELENIVGFIKVIQNIFYGMLGISVIGMLLSFKNMESRVLYTIIICISLIVVFLGKIPIEYIKKKNTD